MPKGSVSDEKSVRGEELRGGGKLMKKRRMAHLEDQS